MSQALSNEDINSALTELKGWSFENDKIKKTFEFTHFREAMSFLVRLSFDAEEHNHHPEIFNVYKRVEIALQTHDAGNKVTSKDIALAKAIESFSWL